MRIALVVPEYPPYSIGGGGVVFEAIATHLARRNEVAVFTLCQPGVGAAERALKDGVLLHRYPGVDLGRIDLALRTVGPVHPRYWWTASRDLSEWSPDVAHVHGYGYMTVDLGAACLRGSRVPYLFTDHGMPTSPSSRPMLVRGAYDAYRRAGPQRTAGHAAGLTSVSAGSGVKLSEATGREVAVIPNGFSGPEHAADQVRSHVGRGKGVLVVAAGRLAPSKGFDILISALQLMDVRPLTCVIAGADGGARSGLERLAQSCASPGLRIEMPGELQRDDLLQLFRDSTVVAMPSRDEPFGLVALEALAMGCAVVASNVGGLPDFVAPPLGRTVQPNDPAALASALDDACRDTIPISAARRQAVNLCANYSWEAIVPKYEEALTASLDGNAPGGRRRRLLRRSRTTGLRRP